MAFGHRQVRPSLYEQVERELAHFRSRGEAARSDASAPAVLALLQACGEETLRVLDRLRDVHDHPALRHLQPYSPGAKKFVCLQDRCTNHCCKKAGQVIETYPQVERDLRARTGLPVVEFVTQEQGRRVLRKAAGTNACVFLDDRDGCTVQEVKPFGCRMYPFVVALIDVHPDGRLTYYPAGRQIHRALQGRAVQTFDRAVGEHTADYHFLVPFLLHYTDCPGFTGDEIALCEYLDLAEECFACSWQWWSAELETVS